MVLLARGVLSMSVMAEMMLVEKLTGKALALSISAMGGLLV